MRFIKTQDNFYVKIPENDDYITFTYEEVGNGLYEALMIGGKDKPVTWLTHKVASEVYIKIILDEMMMFITETDDAIIDMDVIVMLASQRYDPEKDLPF